MISYDEKHYGTKSVEIDTENLAFIVKTPAPLWEFDDILNAKEPKIIEIMTEDAVYDFSTEDYSDIKIVKDLATELTTITFKYTKTEGDK